MKYKTSADKCDVSDFCRLRDYRFVTQQAHELLRGDPSHSILSQILEMFWQDACFRIFNRARRANGDKSRKTASMAPLLASFLDGAYVQGEVLAISRLTDAPSSDPDKGVVSIPAVTKLLKDNHNLITREMFVCHDGSPFDYQAAEAKEDAYILQQGITGAQWVEVPSSFYSESAHKIFDRLSGRRPDQRRRDDVIKPGLIRWLNSHIQGDDFTKVRNHRNKILAHKATRQSRGPLERLGISLAAADGMHRRLLEAAEVLSWSLLGEPLVGNPIPTAQFDQLEGFDRMFVFPEDIDQLHAFWGGLSNEREQWSRSALDAAPCKQPARRP